MKFNSNMSFDERERFAYASGLFELADELRVTAELEDQVTALEEDVFNTEKEAFQRGKDEGLGEDSADVIKELQDDLQKSKILVEESKKLARECLEFFHTDLMKTVAGRKKIHQHLQSKLIQLR